MSLSLEEKFLNPYGGQRSLHLSQSQTPDHVSGATRLLENRRQMFEVQEALSTQKEEFKRREDAFKRREEGLRRKDVVLQESLVKFNKFLQENEAKKNRALKRAADEKKQREAKESEIKRFEIQLSMKLREEGILKEELERNLRNQEYLESVVLNMSKFFPEIPDVLNRYKTLRDANIYLLEKQQSDEGSNENTLREYLTFKKTKENQVLNNNNEIAGLQVRMEHKQAKTNTMQDDIDNAILEASEKALSLGQILSSVSNILDRCEETFRRRHSKPQIDRSTDKSRLDVMSVNEQCLRTMGKLDEIAMFMADFKDIREEFSKDPAAQTLYRQKGWATLTGTSGADRDQGSKYNSEPVTARSGFTSRISY